MLKRIPWLFAALLLFAAPALAQNEFPTPTAGKTVIGVEQLCLNSSGQAIPIGPSCANPLPVSPTNSSGAPLWTQALAGAFQDGWDVTKGTKGDAANTATDTTPVSAMSVWKQISKSVQAAVTALGSPFQANGSIGNTAFGATQSGTWAVTPTVPAASTMTLTATTTAYTAGQLIANNGTAGNITNPSFAMPAAGGAIPRLRLYTDDTLSTAWAGASVQIDLWDDAVTWTNGDHGTWLPSTGASGHHLASYSCTFPSAVWGDGIETNCSINVGNYLSTIATTIYWSLQATSGSGVLTASKHISLKAELN